MLNTPTGMASFLSDSGISSWRPWLAEWAAHLQVLQQVRLPELGLALLEDR